MYSGSGRSTPAACARRRTRRLCRRLDSASGATLPVVVFFPVCRVGTNETQAVLFSNLLDGDARRLVFVPPVKTEHVDDDDTLTDGGTPSGPRQQFCRNDTAVAGVNGTNASLMPPSLFSPRRPSPDAAYMTFAGTVDVCSNSSCIPITLSQYVHFFSSPTFIVQKGRTSVTPRGETRQASHLGFTVAGPVPSSSSRPPAMRRLEGDTVTTAFNSREYYKSPFQIYNNSGRRQQTVFIGRQQNTSPRRSYSAVVAGRSQNDPPAGLPLPTRRNAH